MLSVLLGMLLFEPAMMSLSTQQFEITICRGTPGGSREKGELEVLSSPQIVTRHNQQAMISVGSQIPIITDINKQGSKEIRTLTQTQVGIILKMTPKVQDDGSIFIKSEICISDAISQTSTSVRTVTFHEMVQPGENRMIPFYNPSDYVEQHADWCNFFGIRKRNRPFHGNEMWMTIKVVSPQGNPKALQAVPEPVPLLGNSK